MRRIFGMFLNPGLHGCSPRSIMQITTVIGISRKLRGITNAILVLVLAFLTQRNELLSKSRKLRGHCRVS